MRGGRLAVVVGGAVAGGLYWLVVARVTGVAEPWDSPAYWSLWYPVSFAVAAALGWVWPRHGWLAETMAVLAQFPVMLLGDAPGSLFMVGLLVAGALALPAAVLAFLSGQLATLTRAGINS